MKMTWRFIWIALLAFAFQRCGGDEVSPVIADVQFNFGIQVPEDFSGRINGINLPYHAALLVTIETQSGKVVVNRHKLNLLRFEDEYVAEPLMLRNGRYTLTEFLVIDDDSQQVLYATPRIGSALAATVAQPLPIIFNGNKNKPTLIELQIINIDTRQPMDFGMNSFIIN